MNEKEKRALIHRYTESYNTFDIEGLMDLPHPDILFENVSGDEVTAQTSGTDQFKALAEQSTKIFSSRKQTVTSFADML